VKPSLSHYLAVLLIVSVGADGSSPKQTTRSAGTAARFGICTKYSSSTLALASQNFVLPDVCLTAYPKKSLISTHLSKVQIRQHQHALVCPHHRRLPPSDDGNRAQPANCGRLPKRSLLTPNWQYYIPRRKIFQTRKPRPILKIRTTKVDARFGNLAAPSSATAERKRCPPPAAHVCRCSLPGGGQVGGWRARTRHAAGDTGAAAARRRAPGPNRPRRSPARRRSRPAAWRLLGPRAPASGETGSGEPATVNDDRKGRAAAGPRGPPIRPTASGTPSLMGPARQLPRRTTWRACLPD
jgi:hypothetical protein